MRVADDAELVQRARSGDGAAFDELFGRHHRTVHAVAYQILGDRDSADDAVQETFIRVHRGLGSFRMGRAVKPWLMRVAVNTCLSYRRRAHQRPTQSFEVAERLGSTGVHTDGLGAVREALNRLKPRERAIIVLRHVCGHSYEEIAQILGSSARAVGVRLHRARTKLRGELAQVDRE
jgi:RNA polymerase sigma-70 factor (ECF subfamily)